MATVEQLITDNLDIWSSAMKPKSAAGRGTSKKTDLYGIKKLRELILELAVRGLLVPQDPNDEPASELLKKIAIEKSKLVKEGGIKKQKTLPPIVEDKKPFVLPRGWEFCQLEYLSEINGGFAFKSSMYTEDGVRVVRISDFDEKGFKHDKVVRYEYTDDLEQYQLFENNILMAMTGGTVGKCLFVQRLPERMVVNQRVATIKLLPSVLPAYINCVLQTLTVQNIIHEAKNSTNDNISMSDIKGFLIAFPSSAEQHRIVAKVDELMALCDQLEQQTETSISAHKILVQTLLEILTDTSERVGFNQAWTRIAEHFDTLFSTEWSIDQLKQTILQLAVMGKLVEQNSNDEPVSKLLKKIALEKTKLLEEDIIKKQKPLPPIEEGEKTFESPVGWEWVRFDDLSLRSKAGWSPRCEGTPREGEKWGVLKVSAVTWGEYNPDENKALPDNLEPRPEHEVMPGDFLISRANTADLVARAVVVPTGAPPQLMMSDKIIRFVFTQKVNHTYLKLVNDSTFSRTYYARVAGGTSSSMKNISREHIRNLVVALPPSSEQQRIVNKVNELMALCNTLKSHINTEQITKLHLADAMAEQAIA